MDQSTLNASFDNRIQRLELQISNINLELQAVQHGLKTNTDLTTQSVKNTEAIVHLLQGGKIFGKLVIWVVGTTAAVTVIYAAIKSWVKVQLGG